LTLFSQPTKGLVVGAGRRSLPVRVPPWLDFVVTYVIPIVGLIVAVVSIVVAVLIA
jgi:hypothetical protein